MDQEEKNISVSLFETKKQMWPFGVYLIWGKVNSSISKSVIEINKILFVCSQ